VEKRGTVVFLALKKEGAPLRGKAKKNDKKRGSELRQLLQDQTQQILMHYLAAAGGCKFPTGPFLPVYSYFSCIIFR